MMKKIVLTGLILLAVSGSFAQKSFQISITQPPILSAVAGNDTTFCKTHSVVLGGDPTAIGGSGEYYYIWSPPTGLDNPLSANPTATPEETTVYMVKVTDGNQCTATAFVTVNIDPCTGISETELRNTVTIYPNPVRDNLQISLPVIQDQEQISLRIYTAFGQLKSVIEQTDTYGGLLSIDVSEWDKGLYILQVIAGRKTVSKRIQIQ